MPKTNEVAFNVELANVLRAMHPLWHDKVGAEQHAVFQQVGLRPDILIRHPVGLPVAIETEFEPARSVELDARDRLRHQVERDGETIEQTIAVRVPAGLREGQQDLAERIRKARFSYCVYFATAVDPLRWPHAGWLEGSAQDVAACVERISISERLIAEGMGILELRVSQAANRYLDDEALGFDRPHEHFSEMLHQEPGEQTARMAMAILANALVFHNSIAAAHGLKPISELRDELGDISPLQIQDCWHMILREINYWPIFSIANRILGGIRPKTRKGIVELLSEAADSLARVGVTSQHDMSGRMFQRLIVDRKFLATFYTLPTSAALLAELAVNRLGCDWSEAKEIKRLCIADLACGTGTLISAAYQALLGRHRRAGGNDAKLHRSMMERSMIAADIMPAATHMAATMLSGAHPGLTFRQTRVFTMPYGAQGGGRPLALGSLDLIADESARPLFGTGRQVSRGDAASGEARDEAEETVLRHGSADLIIMNPPFTRPTNHESATVPVPSFAGFGKTGVEQRAMAKHLARIRTSLDAVAGHGNAGIASNFFDLAHVKAKPGGTVALVLPAACVSGRSWGGMREILGREYRDLAVVTIAASGNTDRAFSADTGMAEVLLVATKKSNRDEETGSALFVNLQERPKHPAAAAEIARAVARVESGLTAGKVRLGTEQVAGSFVRAPLSESGCAGVAEEGLAEFMMALQRGRLKLPRMKDQILPTTQLGSLGARGLVHRDISGAQADGAESPRGPFDVRPLEAARIAATAYPMLWTHAAERERTLVIVPDSQGVVRQGRDDHAVEVWTRTATRLHCNLDFRLNSQSLAACLTAEPSIGGTAWPNFRLERTALEDAVVLCANSTLGLMAFWWVATRQQQGRARITITTLPDLPILDVRSFTEAGIAKASKHFEEFRDRRFLPANEAYRDEARKDLDRAVLVDLFGLPEKVLEAFSVIRNQWCAEPSVHGGKQTGPRAK